MSIVSCALSPLGFGTTHSWAPSSDSGCRPSTGFGPIERRPVGRNAGDGNDKGAVLSDERGEPHGTFTQLDG